tara:strand:- start:387 stop:1106 length:720 start_codon:yes stop_codon:yes gene_type:complete
MKIITDEIKTRSPYKDLFAIKSATLSAITKSMKKDGFNEAEPLVYWQIDSVGHVLVDGHTRLEAAKQAGLQEVHAVRMNFDNELKAVEYAISRQKNRRNLTELEIVNCMGELDKLRQAGRPSKELAPHGANLDTGKSSASTAEALGISQRKVERIRTVQDYATPEVKEAIQSGDMSINKAYNETQARRKEEKEEPKDEEQGEEERGIILNDYAAQIVKQLKSKGCTSEEVAYVFSIAKY